MAQSESSIWHMLIGTGLTLARFLIYFLTVQAIEGLSTLAYETVHKKQVVNVQFFDKVNRNRFIMFAAAAVMLYLSNQKLYANDLPMMLVAYLIVKYPEIETSAKSAMTLGAGLAYSYIEGYLVYVLPPDGGGELTGLQHKISTFESQHSVTFPVKRLFVIVTKSMYGPPNLKEFNDKSDKEDVNRLEACLSFEEIVKDVAGVKRRNYTNSVYKIVRPNKVPVYIAAECALHTLHKVISNKQLYDSDLFVPETAGVNVSDVVSDFAHTLRSALDKCPDLKNKCEVVYYDDTNETSNLADVLLDRIKKVEPNFEQFVNRRNKE